jgi:cell wall-associated NlpC family hydrolase
MGRIRPTLVGMRVAVVASVLAFGLVVASPAVTHADDPTVDQLEAQLVQSRVRLNELYQRSAAASEQLNGARYRLGETQKRLDRERRSVRDTHKQLDERSAAVAALTVEQLQNGADNKRLEVLLGSETPTDLLERAAAYESTADAATAMLDELSASQTVHKAAVERMAATEQRMQSAVDQQAAAERAIATSITAAESAAASTQRERDRVLRELAAKRNESLAVTEQRQAVVDAKVDGDDTLVVPPATPPSPDAANPQVPPAGQPATEAPQVPPPAPPAPTPEIPIPPAASGSAATVIAFAMQHLGDPYKWGGAGPKSWDCSGLTMRAWEAAGVKLPHYAGAQYSQGSSVSMNAIQPGDLLFWGSKPSSASHVAIYLGNNTYIHAPRPGQGVEIRTFDYWVKPKFAARPGG